MQQLLMQVHVRQETGENARALMSTCCVSAILNCCDSADSNSSTLAQSISKRNNSHLMTAFCWSSSIQDRTVIAPVMQKRQCHSVGAKATCFKASNKQCSPLNVLKNACQRCIQNFEVAFGHAVQGQQASVIQACSCGVIRGFI